MFDIPILFITYNRYSTASLVFNKIRMIKPKKLYFASNFPKKDKNFNLDLLKVKRVRSLIDRVDWHCKVYKIFRKKYLPVYKSIPAAIDFFFKKEKWGIILEDDCLPSLDFFNFCKSMLKKYQNKNINSISGSRFTKQKSNNIYFSKYNHCWGWATWRESWKNFDQKIKFWRNLKKSNYWQNLHKSSQEREYWSKIFDKVSRNKINTWDYSWTATAWYHRQLSIIPPIKLVKNIGFGPEATWTIQSKQVVTRFNNRLNKFQCPKKIFHNEKLDLIVFKNFFFKNKSLINFFLRILSMIFNDPKTLFLKLKRSYLNAKEIS